VLRSIRALLLFWTIIFSYAWEWLLARVFSPERVSARLQRAHLRNARRLAAGFARLRGVFIKMGQVLSVVGTFLPAAFGEALEALQDKGAGAAVLGNRRPLARGIRRRST